MLGHIPSYSEAYAACKLWFRRAWKVVCEVGHKMDYVACDLLTGMSPEQMPSVS